MKRIAQLLFPLLWLPCHAQVIVSPIVQPHVTFVNASGQPCSGCSFYSYAAGTTTPLATYTDATGTSQNTNPIILDAAGGANIWPGPNSYKFVLQDTSGATIWTVDQVNAGSGLFTCGSSGAIQIANSTGKGLTCDTTITINTTTHSINVGTLPANYVTIGALGTPTSWTFDTTSPATALASLGGAAVNAGTLGQLGYYAAAGRTISGTSVIPAGITAITQAPTDNSTNIATTAYVAAPGGISPTALAINGGTALTDNQGNGAKVQHSTGSTTTNDCPKYDANGNIVDAGFPCITPGTDYYFSFSGCELSVSGNSFNCTGTASFGAVTPAVPTQPDANYYLGCTTYTTQGWGSSTGINSVSTTGFTYAENVDRYNGISATVFPIVWCHLHHN